MTKEQKKKRSGASSSGEKMRKRDELDDLFFDDDTIEEAEPKKKRSKADDTDELEFTAAPKAKKSTAKHKSGAKRTGKKRRKGLHHTIYGTLAAVCAAVTLLIACFCALCTVQYFDFLEMRALLDRDVFYPGITVDGVDLSGYTLADAMDLFRERELSAAQDKGLVFELDGEKYAFDAVQIGYGSNYAAVLQGAWDIGRDGTLAARYENAQEGCEYTISRGYDESFLRSVTDALAQDLTTESVDAEVTGFIFNRGEFTFSEGRQGFVVDAQQLFDQARAALEKGDGTVQITREVIEPNVTQEQLQAQYGELSVAVTNASSSNDNRINNIRLACSSINICLQPGEEFSFNGVVGQRTREAGYKKAGVYVSGELGEEIGGGICQVSTTLFNAVVKADLEITERHNHSRPVSYVDNGKDATVSWGSQDFKFVNSSDEPVYIVAYVTDEWRVKVHVFGKLRTDGLEISVVPVLQETVKPGSDTYKYTPDLPTGQTRVKSKARKGYRVNTYKAYTDAQGNVVDKVFLCSSYYPAAAAVIEVGK